MMEQRDRPDEVEVTPEMIEAGVKVLWESGSLETYIEDLDRMLVHSIFISMRRAASCRSSLPSKCQGRPPD